MTSDRAYFRGTELSSAAHVVEHRDGVTTVYSFTESCRLIRPRKVLLDYLPDFSEF